MKALSLWQPWASAVVYGVKRNETRSWSTRHRGWVAICAAKRRTQAEREAFEDILSDSPESRAAFGDQLALDYDLLPRGQILGYGYLASVFPSAGFEVSTLEDAWGDYEPGRFVWCFHEIWRLATPLPCVGRQGLFELAVPDDFFRLQAEKVGRFVL